MRSRLLAFVAFPVALLSGVVLFRPLHRPPGGWLDAVFLVSVLTVLVLLLSGLMRLATATMGRDDDQDAAAR